MSAESVHPTGSTFNYTLNVPNSSDSIDFNLELVPAESLPADFDKVNSNVAKVSVGDRAFFAVMGRTRVK